MQSSNSNRLPLIIETIAAIHAMTEDLRANVDQHLANLAEVQKVFINEIYEQFNVFNRLDDLFPVDDEGQAILRSEIAAARAELADVARILARDRACESRRAEGFEAARPAAAVK